MFYKTHRLCLVFTIMQLPLTVISKMRTDIDYLDIKERSYVNQYDKHIEIVERRRKLYE